MSELKARLLGQTMNEYGCDTKIYLKSEADKVIAELKNYADEFNKDFELVDNQNERLLKIIQHQKYKRCFKLARWCVQMMVFNSRYGTDKKWHLFKKWRKRWLELAEKFKEAK